MRRMFAVILLAILGTVLGQVSGQDETLTPSPSVTPEEMSSPPETSTAIETPLATLPPFETATSEPNETPISSSPETLVPTAEVTALDPTPIMSETDFLAPTAAPDWRLKVRELFDTLPVSPWVIPSAWRRDETQRLTAVGQVSDPSPDAARALPPLRYDAVFETVQVQAAFFLVEGTSAAISVHVSESGAYHASLTSAGDVQLLRGTDILAETSVSLLAQDSHILTLTFSEGALTVLVDNTAVLTARDAAPLPAGAVEIGGTATADTSLALDDVFIWLPASEIVPTQPVVVIEASPEPTHVPSATVTAIPLPTVSDQPLPLTADGDVSAQGGIIALDTPTTSTIVITNQTWNSETWNYVLPAANNSYFIEVERLSGTLQLNIEVNTTSTFNAVMSSGGHTLLWLSSPTGGTKSFTIVPEDSPATIEDDTEYRVTVHSCCKPEIPLNGYAGAGPVVSSQSIAYWAYNLSEATPHYLEWYRYDDGGNLSFHYTIRRRSDSQVVAQGLVLSDRPSTAIYVPTTDTGWYDVELKLQLASGELTYGSYDIGLFHGNPFPPAPANVVKTHVSGTSATFTFDSDPTGKTEYFELRRALSPEGPFEIVNIADASETLVKDITLQCGTEYIFKLKAYNWATASVNDGDSDASDVEEEDFYSDPVPVKTLPCAAPNDERFSPTSVTTLPRDFTVSGLVTSTNNQGDPRMSCAASGYNASLWYRLSFPTSHMLEVNTFGSTYDTLVAIYRADAGESIGDPLTELACHDDKDLQNGDKTSQVVITTEPNKIYYVLVASWISVFPTEDDVAHVHFDSLKPPAAPTLQTPVNNGATKGWLVWNSVPTASEYHVQVSTTSTFANRLWDEYIGATATVIDSLPDAKYYWRVRAVTPQGLTGNWSPVWVFTKDIVPPNVPGITAPVENAVLTTLRPSLVVSPVAGATRYEWEVAKTTAFGSSKVVITPSFTTTTTLALTQSLPQGQYYARVRACDAATNCKAWTQSPIRAFQIDLRQIPASNGQIIVANATTPLTLRWGLPQGVSTYTLEISPNAEFTSIVHTEAMTYPKVTTTIPSVAGVLTNGSYYWRLVLDDLPDTSAIARRFSLTPPVAPAPKLNAQPNGGILKTPTIALSWNDVTVTYPYPVTYELQVDNQSTFASPEYTAPSVNGLSQTTSTLGDGVYYARVRAVNPYDGVGAWSAAQRVTVDITRPATPVITSPYLNAWSSNARQPVAWKAVPGAVRYFIQYSRVGDFSDSPLPVDANIAAAAAPVYTPTVSLPQGDYTIRVWARDAAGNDSFYSTSVTYTYTANTQPISNGTVTTPRPVFRWAAVPGATQYQVIVGQDPTCTTGVMHTSAILKPPTLAYTYPVTSAAALELTYNTYYWCVAVNRGPAFGDVLEMPHTGFRLNISPAIPPTLTITVPDGLSPIPSSVTAIWWKDLPPTVLSGPYTFTYQVQVDDNPLFNETEFDQVTDGASGNYIETTLPNDGKYYVRARAINNYDAAGPWSAVRPFVIDTTPPNVPTLVTPAQYASITTLAPTISWTAVPTATAYYVEISHKDNFSVSYGWQVTTATTTVPFALLNQTYYVRVQSVDIADNRSAFSASRMFNVQWPTTQAPIGMQYTTGAPILSWEGVTWAAQYEVQVSANSAFTKIIAGSPTSMTTFGVPSLVDGVYYWRVRAKNATTWLAWSDVVTIAVDAP